MQDSAPSRESVLSHLGFDKHPWGLVFTPWRCDLGLQANHDSAMILHNCGVRCLCTLGVMCTAFARGQFSVDVDREWTHFLTSHPAHVDLGRLSDPYCLGCSISQ